ncbi:hypothetical protein [Parabacteroides sp. FAFU027]|uniref:hypothetical protein n=1 Tax=Parabacteroides sp. FAFU027 TaxID=2922715 RepID=UPI001FAE8F6D|nr:hypothetical protein [Parabacteroides sp. FAFU027]
MKILFIPTLLIILTTACNHKKADLPKADVRPPFDTLMINGKVYALDSISENYYNSVHYKYPSDQDTIPLDTNRIKQTKEGIKIHLQNNQIIFLKNDSTEQHSPFYHEYIKTLSHIPYVHVNAQYSEYSYELFINLKNGTKMELWEPPLFSPSKKYFVCASSDLIACFEENGIQLYKEKNGGFDKVFEKEILDWGPDEVKWENDSCLVIKRAKVDKTENLQFDYVRLRLKI